MAYGVVTLTNVSLYKIKYRAVLTSSEVRVNTTGITTAARLRETPPLPYSVGLIVQYGSLMKIQGNHGEAM